MGQGSLCCKGVVGILVGPCTWSLSSVGQVAASVCTCQHWLRQLLCMRVESCCCPAVRGLHHMRSRMPLPDLCTPYTDRVCVGRYIRGCGLMLDRMFAAFWDKMAKVNGFLQPLHCLVIGP